MRRLNMLLLAALIASSLVLVKTAYESRQLYAALDNARAERQQLDAEYKRLAAEAQAQGTHLRVERTARERLQMRSATPAVTFYAFDAAASEAAPASSAAPAPEARGAQ